MYKTFVCVIIVLGDGMLITKIEKLRDNKYKIIIDNEKITTYDNVILENNLLYKKCVDSDLYNKILKETKYYDVYNRIVKYILKRRRSEKEIRDNLLKYDLSNVEIDKIILKLKDIKLINDVEYCKAFINDNIYLSKNGINKIKKDLLDKNISADIIENSLNDVDMDIFDERLEKIIMKKINSNKKYSKTLIRQKILNEMINLGYDKNKILDILENNLVNDNNIIKKEFDKVYIKLSKKYSGVELLKKSKQKMLAKGFNLDEINNLLQEKTED